MSTEPPLSPPIASQLNLFLTYSPLSVKVEQIWSPASPTAFPFCLDYVKWGVIYESLRPSFGPDVVISVEDDDFDPLGDIAREGEARVSKSSLSNWNSKDPSRLMALVHVLRFLLDTNICI